MFRRAAVPTAILAVTIAVASGCGSTPAPVETTADALTEDEAFAAAEETYRAYVEALNQVDLSDPETFEAVYALTTGDANANERKNLSKMHADGWSVSGATSIDSFVGTQLTRDDDALRVLARVCSDISAIAVTDAAGKSQVSDERPDRYALDVSFVGDSADLRIDTSNAVEDATCG